MQQRPFRVAFLLIDGFALMSYTTVVEPLRAANRLFAKSPERPLYEWLHIPAKGDRSVGSTGAIIMGDSQIDAALDIDLLLIIAGGDPFQFDDKKVFSRLREMAASGIVIGGISGGPVIMVRAGLMAGRRMTVHWEHADGLREMALDLAPNMRLLRTLYVIDRNRITCAGGVAPLDLMHALLSNHHGACFARDVSDWFLHTEIRPPGGAQKSNLIARYGVNHPLVIQAIDIMENHIADPLSLSDLASQVQCTSRHLNRLFKQYLQRTTMTFYRQIRLKQAKQLLRQTSLSTTDIALETGFSDSAHFSTAFKKLFDLPPREYRLKATCKNR